MIRRAVTTWVTAQPDAPFGAAGWPTPAYHKWIWRGSCYLLRQLFDEVVLYADAAGIRDLGDLPWTDVVEIDGSIYGPLWGVAKLDTQLRQRVPFLHVDGDFLLYRFDHRSAPFVMQCVEPVSRIYPPMIEGFQRHGYAPYHLAHHTFCAGVVGGCDLSRIHDYAKFSRDLSFRLLEVVRSDTRLSGIEERDINFYVEQYTPTMFFRPHEITRLGSIMQFRRRGYYDHLIGVLRGYRDVQARAEEALTPLIGSPPDFSITR